MKFLSIYIAGLIVLASSCQSNVSQNKINPRADPDSPTGIYIPEDLLDALAELDQMLSPEAKQEMLDIFDDKMVVGVYHFGLGMWIRNNWGLWGGERLAAWFNDRGITHPDDMSGIILVSYRRHLKGEPLKLDEQIAFYIKYWLEAKRPEDPCPECKSPLNWKGGGGDQGHGLECVSCGLAYHYHHETGLIMLPLSRQEARERAIQILEKRIVSPEIIMRKSQEERFRNFITSDQPIGSLSFGNHLNTFEQRLVWSFSWWGQDIEEPKDNLMWIDVDVRTGKQEVRFSYLKSEEDQIPDPFAGPRNSNDDE